MFNSVFTPILVQETWAS